MRIDKCMMMQGINKWQGIRKFKYLESLVTVDRNSMIK